jgi:hypothetical protein
LLAQHLTHLGRKQPKQYVTVAAGRVGVDDAQDFVGKLLCCDRACGHCGQGGDTHDCRAQKGPRHVAPPIAIDEYFLMYCRNMIAQQRAPVTAAGKIGPPAAGYSVFLLSFVIAP